MVRAFAVRLRRRWLAFGSMLVVGILAPQAAAELLVYEPFNYPLGEQLIGKNGGTGFTGAWRDETITGAATIQPGLTYPGLPVSGNSVLMSGATGVLQIFRDHTNVPGADGTQTWLSFIGQRLGAIQDPPANPENPYPRGVNISFYNTEFLPIVPGRERFAIGGSTDGPSNNWAFIGQGQVANFLPATNPPAPYGGAPPAWVVVRIDHHGPPDTDGPGNLDDVYLFINPDPTVEPTTEVANAVRLGTDPNAFDYSGLDYLRPFIGNTSGGRPYGELLWDELRIGTSYFDVSGEVAVPVIPGDTDGDGIGGEFPDDFNPIRDHFRQMVALRTEGDLVRDGFVDFKDFREWKAVFLGQGGSLADVDLNFLTSVPEPASWLLALLASFAVARVAARRPR